MRGAFGMILLAACAGPPKEAAKEARMERGAIVYVAAPYDDVWAKLTTAEELASWFSSGGLEFPDEPGGEMRWGAPGRVVARGTLRAIEKGRGFAHTWKFSGLGFDEPETEVSWEVVAQGPVVMVRVRQRATNAPETMALIGETGWAKALNRLKTLLETGTAMPWPE